MKVEIDIRPPKDSVNTGFIGIRLRPETSEEFGQMEHILEFAKIKAIKPINSMYDRYYLISFETNK